MHSPDFQDSERESHASAEKAVLAWHGFGSPVGWAILIFSTGAAALMWRLALFGWGDT